MTSGMKRCRARNEQNCLRRVDYSPGESESGVNAEHRARWPVPRLTLDDVEASRVKVIASGRVKLKQARRRQTRCWPTTTMRQRANPSRDDACDPPSMIYELCCLV